MKKILLIGFIVLLGIGFAAYEWNNEDYRVYSDIISTLYKTETNIAPIIIYENTDISYGEQNIFDCLTNMNITAKDPICMSYIINNQKNIKLTKRFERKLNGKIYILTKKEEDKIFSNRTNAWKEIDKKFGKHRSGLQSFSRIGYNYTKSKALVCWGNMLYDLSGAGFVMYLEKIKHKWIIKYSHMIWQS